MNFKLPRELKDTSGEPTPKKDDAMKKLTPE